MGWEDRSYYRERGRGVGNPLMWLLSGSVPLGTLFGIRVRAHAALILLIALTLLFDYSQGYDLHSRVVSMTLLFGLVLLHEFGHCFAARWMGGTADEILMWPLGGLAYTDPPRRPWPSFVTAAGGPLVNLAICILAAAGLWFTSRIVAPWNPFTNFLPTQIASGSLAFYLWWVFAVSYLLFLFNLLPIFPLDGGQILQTFLWPKLGYYRSMYLSCITGMVGAVALAIFGILDHFNSWMITVGIVGFLYCMQRRMMLKAMGPSEFQDAAEYSASLYDNDHPKHHKLSHWAIRRARKLIRKEEAEQARIDAILAKVSAHGMHSLTWREKRTLRKATEHQRQREMELSRTRRG